MVPRVVIRRAANGGEQEAQLRQIKLSQWLAKVELASEAKAVHRPITVLAEVDLIDIGVHEVRLAEVHLKGDRHQRLVHLASHRLARVEEITLHELLGERAAAL